jgi:hypothetical protein
MFKRRPLWRTPITEPSDQVRRTIRRRMLKIKLAVDHYAWRLPVAERIRTARPAPPPGLRGRPAGRPVRVVRDVVGVRQRRIAAHPAGHRSHGTTRRDDVRSRVQPRGVRRPRRCPPIRPRLVQLVGGPVPSDLVARHFTALRGTRLRASSLLQTVPCPGSPGNSLWPAGRRPGRLCSALRYPRCR